MSRLWFYATMLCQMPSIRLVPDVTKMKAVLSAYRTASYAPAHHKTSRRLDIHTATTLRYGTANWYAPIFILTPLRQINSFKATPDVSNHIIISVINKMTFPYHSGNPEPLKTVIDVRIHLRCCGFCMNEMIYLIKSCWGWKMMRSVVCLRKAD